MVTKQRLPNQAHSAKNKAYLSYFLTLENKFGAICFFLIYKEFLKGILFFRKVLSLSSYGLL